MSRDLILATSKDWDSWLAIIKSKAVGYQIWDLINPSKPTRPAYIATKPVKPTLNLPEGNDAAAQAATVTILSLYKIHKDEFKTDLEEWKEQHQAFTKIIDFIHDTVTIHNIVFIQKAEVHPWNYLRALKSRLAPSDQERMLELETQYAKLSRGPGKQDIEA